MDGSARLALSIAVFGVAGVAGVWWGGAAVDRFGGDRMVAVTLVALAAGFAVLPSVATTTAAVLAVTVGWGALAWAFVPAQQHRLLRLHAGPAAVVLALNTSAVHLGFAAGALLGGLVVDVGGRLSAFAVACCAAALILHTVIVRREPS